MAKSSLSTKKLLGKAPLKESACVKVRHYRSSSTPSQGIFSILFLFHPNSYNFIINIVFQKNIPSETVFLMESFRCTFIFKSMIILLSSKTSHASGLSKAQPLDCFSSESFFHFTSELKNPMRDACFLGNTQTI